jgi:adenylate cyclase, class 2
MQQNGSNRETEVKFAVHSLEAFQARLRELGFAVLHAKVFERNTILDTAPLSLRPQGCLLRLREAGEKTTITFKGKASVGRVKSREEIEYIASDASNAFRVFHVLGFQPTFVYEKYRTEFARAGESGIVTLDETPIGVYAELEGEESWIDDTARALGFGEADYITASYGALYVKWCEEQAIAPEHMRFASTAAAAAK